MVPMFGLATEGETDENALAMAHEAFFFFQAEDGIRDTSVTGVQTCALPISCGGRARTADRAAEHRLRLRRHRPDAVRRGRAAGDRKSAVSGKSDDLGGR